jgi:hypothetical protein
MPAENYLQEFMKDTPRPGKKRPGIGQGRPEGDFEPATKEVFDINKFLQNQLGFEFPEEELGRRLNLFGRQMTGFEQQQMRGFQEQFAGRTGGRMSSARGGAELGGQAALARATGAGQIMTNAFNQQMQQRQAALNAYIQKYGIDKNAQLAREQLEAQREQASAGMFGDIFGSLALLPFFFSQSSAGSGSSGDVLGTMFDPISGYEGYA